MAFYLQLYSGRSHILITDLDITIFKDKYSNVVHATCSLGRQTSLANEILHTLTKLNSQSAGRARSSDVIGFRIGFVDAAQHNTTQHSGDRMFRVRASPKAQLQSICPISSGIE